MLAREHSRGALLEELYTKVLHIAALEARITELQTVRTHRPRRSSSLSACDNGGGET
jgi:hypothetical protein